MSKILYKARMISKSYQFHSLKPKKIHAINTCVFLYIFSKMEGILSGINILGLCPGPTILEQNNKTKAIVLRGTQNNF